MTIFKYQSTLSQDKMTGEVRLVGAVVRRESWYDVEKWRQFPVAKRAFFPLRKRQWREKSFHNFMVVINMKLEYSV